MERYGMRKFGMVAAAAVACVSLGLVLAGCGGGKKTTSSTTSTVIQTNPTDPASSQQFIKDFATPTMCAKFKVIATQYGNAVVSGGNYAKYGNKLELLLAGAPEEIKNDFSVLATACNFPELAQILHSDD